MFCRCRQNVDVVECFQATTDRCYLKFYKWQYGMYNTITTTYIIPLSSLCSPLYGVEALKPETNCDFLETQGAGREIKSKKLPLECPCKRLRKEKRSLLTVLLCLITETAFAVPVFAWNEQPSCLVRIVQDSLACFWANPDVVIKCSQFAT